MGGWRRVLCYMIVITFLLINLTACKRPKAKKKPPTKETSLMNFLRILILRLIYGVATMMGAEERLSEFMGGALVPPGVEDGDYRDYGDDEDDY